MLKKLPYLKYFFWWVGVIRSCPECNSKLIRIDKGGWDLYKCSNSDCDFGKRRLHYKFEVWKR